MNPDKKLTVKVITPEGTSYTGAADYVSVPGIEGILGVYRRHAAFFSIIERGEVMIKDAQDRTYLSVESGFVDVGSDHVTILADSASRSEDLSEEKIKEAKRKAEEKLGEKLSRQEYLAAEAELRKTILELKVASRRKRHPNKF